jgi:excisionase family DNA binding protein
MDYVTVKEASERLNVTVGRVHHLIKAGRLPAEKLGYQYAIKIADLKQVEDRKPGRPKRNIR